MDTFDVDGLTGTVAHPDAPSRPPILFVHGYLAGAWCFEAYQRFFAERGYSAYALNLRGHHGSRPVPDPGRVSMLQYADDVTEVVDALSSAHRGPPILLGHSMGGLVAQKVAERRDPRALVLLCSAPPRGIVMATPRLVRTQLAYLGALLRSRPIVPSRAACDALNFNRVPLADRERLFARLVPGSARAGREMSLGLVSVDAARVRARVLSVSAEDDHFIPPRVGRRLAAKYGGDYQCHAGHGHLIIAEPGWERPAAAIDAWLRRVVP